MTAPVPITEDARLAALRDLHILDTPPAAAFEDLTLLASQICGTPIAAVSLVDADRQWFKSVLGLPVSETPREMAFCAHTILEPDVLVVPDTTVDDRFSDNPLVTGDPHIRFYAGAPLVMADGHALGSLCVIDRVPRQLTPAQKAALSALARQVARQIEAGRRESALQRSAAQLRVLIDASPVPSTLSDSSGRILFVNAEFRRTFGYGREDIPTVGDWWSQACPDPTYRDWARATWQARLDQTERDATPFEPLELAVRAKDGGERVVLGSAAALSEAAGDLYLVVMYDITERKQAQQETARLAAILESSRDAIMGMTFDGALVAWNDAAEKLYGWDAGEVIGRHASLLASRDQRGFIAGIIQAVRRGEPCENIEVRSPRRDGAWIDISLTFSPIKNAAGAMIGIGAIGRDITAQKQAENALRHSEEALRTVMEGAPIVFYATDREGIVTLSEGAGLERLGLAPGQVVGQSVFEMYRDVPLIVDNLRRALAGETISYDAQLNGLCYHNEVRPQRDGTGAITGLIGVGHDITERKQAEDAIKDFSIVLEFQKAELEKANAELAALATLDGLTGLHNRRAFDQRLEEEFERASRYHKPLSLIMLDIDSFKQYNDAFGHLAGDEALRRIARVLQKAMRETDFVARYGGEEIVVLLPETDGDGAMQAAERIRLAVATTAWEHRPLTASLGIGTFSLRATSPADLLADADAALYQSKADGRNRVTHAHAVSPGLFSLLA